MAKHTRALSPIVILALGMLFALDGARPASAIMALPASAGTAVTWTGAAGDGRWSNPDNWDSGLVPGSADTARFTTGSPGDAVVDAGFGGTVAGLVIDSGYAGTVTLARDLAISGDVHMESGTLTGGTAALKIGGRASVRGGRLETPGNTMTVSALDIQSPGVVRLGANGKLDLTGDGTPLTGDGLLDVTTNAPNSVEYTGHATSDITAAGPVMAFYAPANVPLGHEPVSKPTASNGAAPLAPAEFGEVGSLSLLRGEDALTSAVIDAANGFAYFGTGSNIGPRGLIVKVRVSDMTRVGALNLSAGENNLTTAVIDTTNGYAYFGTNTSPGIVVKVRLSDFTRVASLTLNPGENRLTSAAIDSASGYAYFGTNTSAYDTIPASIVKVRLSDLTRVAALPQQPGERGLTSAAIDATAGFAYFGGRAGDAAAGAQRGLVLKVQLSDFTRAGSLTLSAGENNLTSAVIDISRGFVYFGTNNYPNPGIVVKVRLLDLTRVGALTFNADEIGLLSAVIDTGSGFAYFGTGTGPGIVVKVRLADFTRAGALMLPAGENWLTSAVIDAANGYAYFGTSTAPGIVGKVRLSDFSQAAALSLNAAEPVCSSVIDTSSGVAYFGTQRSGIVKVRLSDFTRVGTLTLNPGESTLCTAAIDGSHGFAYFGTGTSPGVVVKVRLSDFTRAGALTLNAGESTLVSALIDPGAGYAYFAVAGDTPGNPPSVVKVRLSDFTRVGALALNGTWFLGKASVIDAANGFAYFGAVPGFVIKVRLSDFANVGVLQIGALGQAGPAVIDAANGYAYFGTGGYPNPATVEKVRLSDFTRAGTLTLNTGDGDLRAGVIDPVNGFAYFGTDSSSALGRIVKVRLSDFTLANSLTLNAGESDLQTAAIDLDGGYAYFAAGLDPSILVKVNVGVENLALLETASAATANAGDVLTYTLNINNDSPDAATGLTLTDTLPLSVTFFGVNPGPAACNLIGGQVICNLGTLAAGASTRVTIWVNVTAGEPGLIVNTASVSASEPRFSLPRVMRLTTLINPLHMYFPTVGVHVLP